MSNQVKTGNGLVDYHVHTKRCGHATGDMQDYVRQGMAVGLKEMGFSDHYPMDSLGFNEADMSSMWEAEFPLYLQDVASMQELYGSQLTIRLGIEMDYVRGQEDLVQAIVQNHDFDYVIGSIHFLSGWDISHPKNAYKYETFSLTDLYNEYFDEVQHLVQSGQFDIVGHIDILKKLGYTLPDRAGLEVYDEMARLLSDRNQVVEINTGGLRAPVKECYPSPAFLDRLIAHQVPLTLGSDAHSPEEVGFCFSEIREKLLALGVKTLAAFSKRKPFEIPLEN